jgi:hypothetical protein
MKATLMEITGTTRPIHQSFTGVVYAPNKIESTNGKNKDTGGMDYDDWTR